MVRFLKFALGGLAILLTAQAYYLFIYVSDVSDVSDGPEPETLTGVLESVLPDVSVSPPDVEVSPREPRQILQPPQTSPPSETPQAVPRRRPQLQGQPDRVDVDDASPN